MVVDVSHFPRSHIFPIFPYMFSIWHMFFFVIPMFLVFQARSPMILFWSFFNSRIFQGLPFSPLLFPFHFRGAGTFRPSFSPTRLRNNFLQEFDPHLTSHVLLDTLRIQHATSDINHQTF